MIRRLSDIVIVGDFLDPAEETMAWLDALARRGVRGHVVEIADPAEESFPYAGRTEFSDPETGDKLTAGRAELLGEDYRRALSRPPRRARRLGHLGWTYTVNRTDRLASEALVAVHIGMTAEARDALEASYELPAVLFRLSGHSLGPARAAGDLVAAAPDAAEAAQTKCFRRCASWRGC